MSSYLLPKLIIYLRAESLISQGLLIPHLPPGIAHLYPHYFITQTGKGELAVSHGYKLWGMTEG